MYVLWLMFCLFSFALLLNMMKSILGGDAECYGL